MNTHQPQNLDELAGKIAKLLDEGTRQIDASTSAKLLAIREEALTHFDAQPNPRFVPEWVMAGVGRFTLPLGGNLRAGLVMGALMIALCGVYAWHQAMTPQGSEIADVDEGLLTDELPIHAYLDKGFDSWVKRPSR